MTRQVKRWKVPQGHVYVSDDICKGCGFCIEYCPRKVLAAAKRFNAKGYHPPEVVDAEACVMCGFCELVCPDFAIWTEKQTSSGGDEAGEAAHHPNTEGPRTR